MRSRLRERGICPSPVVTTGWSMTTLACPGRFSQWMMDVQGIDGMRLELRAELRAHTGGKFPPAGRADAPSYSSSVSSSAEPGRTE